MELIQPKVRVLAYYLPQFHPIPENDLWWGKGFTEWTNVGKALPLFKGHYQPRVPADLGYYDLRVPETRQAQAELAARYGIHGFCYWHYWFGKGKQLLERPFNEVVSSGKPNFPFCLAWANESWKGFDHGLKDRKVLIEQTYNGEADYTEHFYSLLPAFKDSRYICVEGRPIFGIYFPDAIPETSRFVDLWQSLAQKNGLQGIYFIGLSMNTGLQTLDDMKNLGMDALNTIRLEDFYGKLSHRLSFGERLLNKIRNVSLPPRAYSFEEASKYFYNSLDLADKIYPTIISGWDHSPRTGREGLIMYDYTPEVFKKHVQQILGLTKDKPTDDRIVFLKSWNEWAEGNYMEPDLRYGHQFLKALKDCLDELS